MMSLAFLGVVEHLPADGKQQQIPWFALLVCVAFALPSKLSLSQPISSCTFPILPPTPPEGCEWVAVWYLAACPSWWNLNFLTLFKATTVTNNCLPCALVETVNEMKLFHLPSGRFCCVQWALSSDIDLNQPQKVVLEPLHCCLITVYISCLTMGPLIRKQKRSSIILKCSIVFYEVYLCFSNT